MEVARVEETLVWVEASGGLPMPEEVRLEEKRSVGHWQSELAKLQWRA
jgi:hypothetical protein